ncbi:MAG: hypothetical protein N3F03_04855 [Ignavibacteria bacterium]|nr:hypothetical protein [Ignavibacteria bacterium]
MRYKKKLTLPSFITDKQSQELFQILNDYSSGSQEILEKIFKFLIRIRSPKKLSFIIQLFKNNFVHFQVIQTSLNELEKILKTKTINHVKNQIIKQLSNYQKRIENVFTRLEKYLKPSLKILTISNSKTIYDLLVLIHNKGYNPKIYVLLSLPGGEGKILYKKLKENRIESFLVHDEKIHQIIDEIDLVFVGADKIVEDKFFINKVKTKKLLLLARKRKKLSFLFALKEKIINETELQVDLQEKLKLKRMRNDEFLFERIKINLVNEIFIA